MFETKKQTLSGFDKKNPASVSPKKSAFVNAGLKRSARTLSGNSALKYSTTGMPFVDEFGQAGSFKKPRSFADVSNSMSVLWAQDSLTSIKFLLYLRMITRQVVFPDGNKTESVQRGQGLKHEAMVRMIWLAVNKPESFWKNVLLYISAGSWKDIFTMLNYDLQHHDWADRQLDWDKMGKLIMAGLENPKTTNLVKKYLPTISSNSTRNTPRAQANNIIAKWICGLLYPAYVGSPKANHATFYKKYRHLKNSGTAHEWQKLISKRQIGKIDFDSVHGRALALLVSGDFLKNNGMETKYQQWLQGKPTVKYTGYVYELLATINSKLTLYQKETINKQFATLVETAKKGAKTETSLIVVRDTSGSMSSVCTGTKVKCYDVAKGLALFFSEMLPAGHFSDSWIEFNNDALMHKWQGESVVDKWMNDHSSYVGGTNFLSVIQLFCRIKAQGIPESEFPTGILCISDGEFNPAQLGMTNVQAALQYLKAGGFSDQYIAKFQIILWNLQSHFYGERTGKKFETFGNVSNVFYFSGLDGSVVAFLTGQEGKTMKPPETAEELFEAAMQQEVLEMVEV